MNKMWTTGWLRRIGLYGKGNRSIPYVIGERDKQVLEEPTEDQIDNTDLHFMALSLHKKSVRAQAYREKCKEWQGREFTIGQVHENTGFLLLERALRSESRVARQAVKTLYLHFCDFNDFEYIESTEETSELTWEE